MGKYTQTDQENKLLLHKSNLNLLDSSRTQSTHIGQLKFTSRTNSSAIHRNTKNPFDGVSLKRLQHVQRSQLITHYASLYGNRSLQKTLGKNKQSYILPAQSQIQLQAAVKAIPTSPLIPEIMDRLSANFFEKPGDPGDLKRNPILRNVLLTLYSRLGLLWNLIPLKSITWVSERGEMDFLCRDVDGIRRTLVSKGYTSSYFAKRSEDAWGLREPTLPVAGLHWRGGVGKVNVHIDLHPPTMTGFYHWLMDSRHRGETHNPETLKDGVERLGLYIPVLYQQKLHGDLTVKFDEMERRAKGSDNQLAIQSEIDTGRRFLIDSAKFLWTTNLVQQRDLLTATWQLSMSLNSVSKIEHLLKTRKMASK